MMSERIRRRRLSPFGFGAARRDGRPPASDHLNLAVAGLISLHLMLYVALKLRLGVVNTVLWYVGPSLLAVLTGGLLLVSLISAIRHRQTWSADGMLRYAVLVALAALPALYRTYPSSHDGQPSAVRFVLPLDGPVTVAWGGEPASANPHVMAPDQRWGYDLLVTDHGRSFRGTGTALTDYLAYGRDVRSPAAGVVHTVHDGEPDVPIGGTARGDDLGNHVALEVAPGEFLFVAHLQPGSIVVRPGDRVEPGDPIGVVGNSGKSQEPHVHLHLQDSDRRHLAEGVPFRFSDYCHGGKPVPEGVPKGGREGGRWTGAPVENAAGADCSAAASEVVNR
jgi:hypothetical protein